MQHVGRGVDLLGLRERPRGPVVLLARGRELDSEMIADQHLEAQVPEPEEASGQRGVEDRAEGEAKPPLEVNEVVVAGVKHDQGTPFGEQRDQRREVGHG